MKLCIITFTILAISLSANVLKGEPKFLTKYLKAEGKFTKAAEGTVTPPKEILPYATKLRKAIAENQEWFKEHTKNLEENEKIPYHENLGMTEDEYKLYLDFWESRAFQAISQIDLRLEKQDDGNWKIRATGAGFPIQSLVFSEDDQKITSLNGTLNRVADFSENKGSLLRAWSGQAWELTSKNAISTTIENFSIGKIENENNGYMIYRLQEISPGGRRTYDKQLLIKFPIK